MSKSIIIAVIACLALIVGALVFLYLNGGSVKSNAKPVDAQKILSFEDCVKAGYQVTDGKRRQCALPDGRIYAEETTLSPVYRNIKPSDIVISTPHAGGVTGKEFLVKGSVRGGWFFEGVFPVEVRSQRGEKLVSTYAAAEGNWMTTESVVFTAKVTVPATYIGPATLILRKDNPSGLRENDASVAIPINVQY